jgi:hypothetical protein
LQQLGFEFEVAGGEVQLERKGKVSVVELGGLVAGKVVMVTGGGIQRGSRRRQTKIQMKKNLK